MRGGKRQGAGRPSGSGRFKEPTQAMRVPESLIPAVVDMIAETAAARDTPRGSVPSNRRYRVAPNIRRALGSGSVLLPPVEAVEALHWISDQGVKASTAVLDPWYSTSPRKVPAKSRRTTVELMRLAGRVSQHVFVWGWPHEIAMLVERIPPPLKYVAWLTWNAKNIPTRSQGWRHTQQACLHISHPGAPMYSENFTDGGAQGLFRHSCDTVIEAGALVGFAGRTQAVGHPAQKPVSVFEPLIKMSTQPGDLVLDMTAGSGTTGVVCQKLGRQAILSDRSDRYVRMMEKRLGLCRLAS